MNNNTYLKLMKEQSSVWTAGKIIEFLEIADDLDALDQKQEAKPSQKKKIKQEDLL